MSRNLSIADLHEGLGELTHPDGYFFNGEKRVDMRGGSPLRSLSPVVAPIASTERIEAAAQEYLDTLSPERRAELETEWGAK